MKQKTDSFQLFLTILEHHLVRSLDLRIYSDGNRYWKKIRRTQYIEFIQESSKSMLSLVNSLLDWTRLQTGRYRFEPERINAKGLIQSQFRCYQAHRCKKNITLISDLDKDFYIHADEELMLQGIQ